jgi:ribosomal protein S18 acetylase RimI-like enzyme
MKLKPKLQNLKIRKLRTEDYDRLIELWQEAKLSFRPHGRDRRDKITEQIKQKCSIFLVAEVEGRLIGSIFGTHDGRRGWINRLAILPNYCRQGIGARLVSAVEKRLTKQGIDIVASLVEDRNKVSMKVFEKLGYKKHNNIVYFSKRKNPKV